MRAVLPRMGDRVCGSTSGYTRESWSDGRFNFKVTLGFEVRLVRQNNGMSIEFFVKKWFL